MKPCKQTSDKLASEIAHQLWRLGYIAGVGAMGPVDSPLFGAAGALGDAGARLALKLAWYLDGVETADALKAAWEAVQEAERAYQILRDRTRAEDVQ